MTGFKSYLYKWTEQYLFFPNILQKLISVALFPFTVVYCVVVAYKRIKATPIDFGLPIISIGNLIVGGSGKTPVTISLVKQMTDEKVAIILRGYGRVSKGLYVVSHNNEILVDVEISGDEAMLLAQELPNSIVIVSENRKEAIVKAKELGATVVFLDDGYRHHDIKKFDIILRPAKEPTNLFCLPSGGYRETKMMYSFVDIVLTEEIDFKRVVTFKQNNITLDTLPTNSVILTAISKPERLLDFVPSDTTLISYPDHHYFTQDDLDAVYSKNKDCVIVTTQKDFVKLEKFNIKNIILMDLDIKVDQEGITPLTIYLAFFQ